MSDARSTLAAAKEMSDRLASVRGGGIGRMVKYRRHVSDTTSGKGTVTRVFSTVTTFGYFLPELQQRSKGAEELPGAVRSDPGVFALNVDRVQPRSEEDECWIEEYARGTLTFPPLSRRVSLRTSASGVEFRDRVLPGDQIMFAGRGTPYRIASIPGATGLLTAASNFAATVTGATYILYRPYQVLGWRLADHQAEFHFQLRSLPRG